MPNFWYTHQNNFLIQTQILNVNYDPLWNSEINENWINHQITILKGFILLQLKKMTNFLLLIKNIGIDICHNKFMTEKEFLYMHFAFVIPVEFFLTIRHFLFQNNSFCPIFQAEHYFSLYGKPSILAWVLFYSTLYKLLGLRKKICIYHLWVYRWFQKPKSNVHMYTS